MHHTRTLASRQELAQLAWTLGRCLDERDFGGLRQIFTPGATVTTRETASGHDAPADQARRRHPHDQGIHHITTSLITDPDGDRATGQVFPAQGGQPGTRGKTRALEPRARADRRRAAHGASSVP